MGLSGEMEKSASYTDDIVNITCLFKPDVK